MRSVVIRNVAQAAMVAAVVLAGVGLLSAIPPAVTDAVDASPPPDAGLGTKAPTAATDAARIPTPSADDQTLASDRLPGLVEILLGADGTGVTPKPVSADAPMGETEAESRPSGKTSGHRETVLAQETSVLVDNPAAEANQPSEAEGVDGGATASPSEPAILQVAMADAVPAEQPAEPSVLTVAMKAPGQVVGRVTHCDEEGNTTSEPAEGYTVSFIQNGEVVGQTTTDADGRYTVTGLTPGLYNVAITFGNGVTAYTVQVLPATEAGTEVPDELVVCAGPFEAIPPIETPPVYFQGPPGPAGGGGGGGAAGLLGALGAGLGAAALGMGGGGDTVVVSSPFVP